MKKFIANLEQQQSFVYSIGTFLAAISVRNFIELISDKPSLNALTFVHYYLSYIALACVFILFISKIARIAISKAARIILPLFLILVIAPILDLIISSGQGYDISYSQDTNIQDLIIRFFTYFGDLKSPGATIGIRIEIALVLIFGFYYVYTKTRSFIRALASVVGLYLILFIFFSLSFISKTITELIAGPWIYTNEVFIHIYLFITLISIFYMLTIRFPDTIKSFIQEISFARIFYYILFFVLGSVIGKDIIRNSPLNYASSSFLNIPMVCLSIFFASMYSSLSNNIIDFNIDIITNKDRMLVGEKISLRLYKLLQYIFLSLAILTAISVNFAVLFFIITFIANYFLYSMPPFRFKRVPYFSKIVIALNSLAMIMMGYFLSSHSSIRGFPHYISLGVLIFVTAAAQFIDLKDYEGDKENCINTLPVLLGLKRSKLVIGLLFIIGYVGLIYIFTKSINLMLIGTVPGLSQFYFINKKKYNEKPIFLILLATLIFLIIYRSITG